MTAWARKDEEWFDGGGGEGGSEVIQDIERTRLRVSVD